MGNKIILIFDILIEVSRQEQETRRIFVIFGAAAYFILPSGRRIKTP